LKVGKINYLITKQLLTLTKKIGKLKKMSNKYNFIKAKTLDLQLKDIDTNKRKVVGYFAAFNNLDSDSDVIRKGAFANSIKAKGVNSSENRRIAHLWNHSWDTPIGKLLELSEDDYGLRFVSQISRSTKGEDVFADYQDGIIREHSVGFYYLPTGITEKVDSKNNTIYYDITDVDLMEGSTVTFGANSLTKVVDVTKGMNVEDTFSELTKQMDLYIDALKNGAGSDERLYQIEMGLKTIQSSYYELLCKNNTQKETAQQVVINDTQKESAFNKLLINYLKN
jgi:HK97 family phage prohead protease